MSASSRPRGWWMPEAGWVAVRVTVLLVIVTFLPGGADPWFGPKVGVLLVGTTAALALHVAALVARRDRVVLPRVGVAVLLYAAAMASATALSVSPLSSLIGRADHRSGLVELVAVLALSWLVVVHTWRRPQKLIQLVATVVAATAVHALAVVLGRMGLHVPWPGPRPYTVPVGTMGNSNFAGAQLVLAVPLAVLLHARATGARMRRAWVGVLVLLVVALVVTDARGAAIALFPALAVSGVVAPTLVPRWSVRVAVVLSVLALVPVAAAAGGFSWGSGSPGAKLLNNETLQSRFVYWRGTVDLVGDHPVVGTGPDTFGLVFPRYAPREMTGRPVPVDKPHNILLERATDAGLPGVASYVAVLALTGAAVVRARRRSTGTPLALMGAWSGVLVAYLVQGLTSIDTVPLALGGWLAIAALATLADPWVRRARDRAGPADEVVRPVPIPVMAAGCAAIVVVLLAVITVWSADRALGHGIAMHAAVARGEGGESAMTASFERAIAVNPFDPAVRRAAAAAAADVLDAPTLTPDERSAVARFAAAQGDRVTEAVPDDIAAHRAAAKGRGVLAGRDPVALEATEQRWRAVEGLDPYDPTLRMDHAHFLLDWNDRVDDGAEAARHAAARALVDGAAASTDDSSWLTWYQVAQAYERLGARDEAVAAARRSLRIERARPGPRDLIERLGGEP